MYEKGDKCAQVRPIRTMIQEKCAKYNTMCHKGDVHESIIPHFGSYGSETKQAMRNKNLTLWVYRLVIELGRWIFTCL